jgi:hypothetical protein
MYWIQKPWRSSCHSDQNVPVPELRAPRASNLRPKSPRGALRSFPGNPAIPRVILIGLKFEVETLVKKGPNYPVSNPWNDRFFAERGEGWDFHCRCFRYGDHDAQSLVDLRGCGECLF